MKEKENEKEDKNKAKEMTEQELKKVSGGYGRKVLDTALQRSLNQEA